MDTKLRETVEAWLEALGCEHESVEDKQTVWHLAFKYPSGRDHLMHVAELKGPYPSITVGSVVAISEQHLQRFAGLANDDKRAFLFGLRRELNHIDIDFELRGISGGLECPASFQVSARRFAEGLTLDEFARTVGGVYKSELGAIWYIQEILEEPSVGPAIKLDFERSNYPEA